MHSELEVAIAAGWASDFGRLRLAAGLQTGLQVFFDNRLEDRGPTESVLPMGFSGTALVEVGLALSESWLIAGYVRPGLMVLRANDAVSARPTFAGGLTGAYAFH